MIKKSITILTLLLLCVGTAVALEFIMGPEKRITTDAAVSSQVNIAADSLRDVHIAWVDTRDGNSEIYYQKRNVLGDAVIASTRVSTDGADSLFPSITTDFNDVAHVVWDDSRDGNSEIYYVRLTSTGTPQTAPIRLTNDPAPSTMPDVAVDAAGDIHVIWVDGRMGYPQIFYKQLDENGQTVSEAEPLTQVAAGGSTAWFPKIVASDPHVYYAYNDDSSGQSQIFVGIFPKGAAFAKVSRPISNVHVDAGYPSLALDNSDRFHLAWLDVVDGNSEIYYAKLDLILSAASIQQVTNDANFSWAPSVAVDSNGMANLTWIDNRTGSFQIHHAQIPATPGPAIENNVITSASDDPTSPQLIGDDYNNLFLSWSDARDGNQEIYFARSAQGDSCVEVVDPCQNTDMDGDGTVNLNDLARLATWFGQNVCAPINMECEGADVNGDGIVNLRDLALLATNFGEDSCTPSISCS